MSENTTFDVLAAHLLQLGLQPGEHQRQIVAIAGAPGAGKSTLVARLEATLNAQRSGMAATVPMDGFHFDDGVLEAMGRRAFKGAPDTFDVGGFGAVLKRLKANTEAQIAVPVFDRGLELSRGSARLILQGIRIVLVEGNWLLLDEEPWRDIHALYDVTVMIEVGEDELRQRLTQRWERYGLSDEAMAHKLDGNDLPNGRHVTQKSVTADFVVGN
ncbi:MAG: nucleoside triphosphate hydrolase [Pseudomonadota bacterium]